MHPDLSPHLHTETCNKLIEELQQCHSQNKVGQFFGTCNKIDSLLAECLRNERKDNSKKNRDLAEQRRQKLKANLEQK